MASLWPLDVFQVVDLPKGVRMLKNKWVLKRRGLEMALSTQLGQTGC
jgi:hypothetical protein